MDTERPAEASDPRRDETGEVDGIPGVTGAKRRRYAKPSIRELNVPVEPRPRMRDRKPRPNGARKDSP